MTISRQQIGLGLVLVGTVMVAYSVRIKDQYGDGPMGDAVKRAQERDPNIFAPADIKMNVAIFRVGLGLIIVGTLLQF
jgi:hypothetical protein